eukprot:760142-Hanusia_phi.AAC.2
MSDRLVQLPLCVTFDSLKEEAKEQLGDQLDLPLPSLQHVHKLVPPQRSVAQQLLPVGGQQRIVCSPPKEALHVVRHAPQTAMRLLLRLNPHERLVGTEEEAGRSGCGVELVVDELYPPVVPGRCLGVAAARVDADDFTAGLLRICAMRVRANEKNQDERGRRKSRRVEE